MKRRNLKDGVKRKAKKNKKVNLGGPWSYQEKKLMDSIIRTMLKREKRKTKTIEKRLKNEIHFF
jgi:hypothetical protein